MNNYSNYFHRLDSHIIPIKYNIRIEPIIPYNKFIGRCIIGFQIVQEILSNQIILNGSGLIISNVKLIGTNHTIYTHLSTDTSDPQQIGLTFDLPLPKIGVLVIEYEGIISTELTGFYKCMWDDKLITVTNFEPVSARHCFPCFDEPHLKAIFELEIVAEPDRLVLSNTNVKTIVPIGSKLMYIFEPTPLMSTYLVAFYIGYGTYIEAYTKDSIRIRIYTHKNKSYSKLALDTAVRCMDWMTHYFDRSYPLDKLDLIAVPEFAPGAMENWGLVIFREKLLICDPEISLNERIHLVYTVCHELAHQWFGNLVTMEWWSDLWLNESFATWIGWLVVDHLYPNWNIKNKFFYENNIRALTADSLQNSHPIRIDVNTPSTIKEIFDTITYQKGSSIIKMLVENVGEKKFRQSIRLYIKRYAYGTTTTNNLWDCIEKITKKDITGMMHNWINKKNYPLVTIKTHGPDHLKIEQSMFTFELNADKSHTLWSIPLSPNVLMKKKKIIISKSHFNTNINNSATGFYRICYHPDILSHIIQNKLVLSDLDMAAILSDLYFLLKANIYTYGSYIEFTDSILCISSESELVCKITLANYNNFKMINKNDKLIESYTSILIRYVKRFDFEPIAGESSCSTLFKIHILDLGCQLGLDSHIKYCLRLFNLYKNKSVKINSDIIQFVFRVGLNTSGGFDFLMGEMSANPDLESVILGCLGLVSNPIECMRVLDLFKGDKVRDQDKPYIFTAVGQNSKLNHMLWPYIKDNWDVIYATFKNRQSGLGSIISSMNYLIGTTQLVGEIKSFFESKDKYNMEFAYNKMIELIQINYAFNSRLNGV